MLVQLQLSLGKNYNVARQAVDHFNANFTGCDFETARLVVISQTNHAMRVELHADVATIFAKAVQEWLAQYVTINLKSRLRSKFFAACDAADVRPYLTPEAADGFEEYQLCGGTAEAKQQIVSQFGK